MAINSATAARMGQWFSKKVAPPKPEGLSTSPAPAWARPATPAATPGILATETGRGTTPPVVTGRTDPTTPATPPWSNPAARGPEVPKPASWIDAAKAKAAASSAEQAKKNAPVKTIEEEDLNLRTENPNATVEERMKGLLADDGEYMQLARSDAQEFAQSRGLLNSTMAAGAGTEAAIRSALPIAQQDADYAGQIEAYNTALKNQALMFNADAGNTYSLAQLQSATQKHVVAAQVAGQLAAAAIAAATSRYTAEVAANTQRYGYDTQALTAANDRAARTRDREIDRAHELEMQTRNNNDTLALNIVMHPEMSAEERGRHLRAIGRGDLADALEVADSTTPDLGGGRGQPDNGSGG